MSTISKICDTLNKALDMARAPLATIPSILLICSAVRRPGLSAQVIAGRIIKRYGEAGAPGTQVEYGLEVIRAEEYVRALKYDSRIQGAIPIGGITVSGTVQTPAGAGTFIGTNVNVPKVDGIIG